VCVVCGPWSGGAGGRGRGREVQLSCQLDRWALGCWVLGSVRGPFGGRRWPVAGGPGVATYDGT
jgi:hypothetical protein